MSLDSFLLGVLVDPVDHESLLYVEDQDVLYNPRRRVAYAVTGSIPVLLPDEARSVSDDEHAAYTSSKSAVETGRSS